MAEQVINMVPLINELATLKPIDIDDYIEDLIMTLNNNEAPTVHYSDVSLNQIITASVNLVKPSCSMTLHHQNSSDIIAPISRSHFSTALLPSELLDHQTKANLRISEME